MVSVLTKRFGLAHIEVAEDIVSDTFLLAAETWGKMGIPESPTAWLYTVAKNKAKDTLKRNKLFTEKIVVALQGATPSAMEIDIDLSDQNITDSQLQMVFAICHPAIPVEAQIGLALRILCGLGIEEIADAFLSNKETINKRLLRAKDKLRTAGIKMEMPDHQEIDGRLAAVLRTLYLLFNEGYYSATQNVVLRKDLCLEAMRLTLLLLANAATHQPMVNALLALMCFHASRFEARLDAIGEVVLYADQDRNLWDEELIMRGEYFLNLAATGDRLSKYHLEAAIAYWHTRKTEPADRWQRVLQLYNQLLQVEYSPAAALNRTYALAQVHGAAVAIVEAEKLDLGDSHLYYCLMGELYGEIDAAQSQRHWRRALQLAKTAQDRAVILAKCVEE